MCSGGRICISIFCNFGAMQSSVGFRRIRRSLTAHSKALCSMRCRLRTKNRWRRKNASFSGVLFYHPYYILAMRRSFSGRAALYAKVLQCLLPDALCAFFILLSLFASAERTISLLPAVPSSVGSIDRCVAAEPQIAHFPLSNAAARKP